MGYAYLLQRVWFSSLQDLMIVAINMKLPTNGEPWPLLRLLPELVTSTPFLPMKRKCKLPIFFHCLAVLSPSSDLLIYISAPFMFHQINLRVADVYNTTINGVNAQRSLYMMWAETIAAKFVSMTNWPLIGVKEDDLIDVYTTRITKDMCNPTTQVILSTSGNTTSITGFVVGATNNTCAAPIPVTIPGGNVTNLQGSTVEQVGNDPMTLWVTLSGAAKTFTLTTPIPL